MNNENPTPPTPDESPSTSVGDMNVEQLLKRSYYPEVPQADFAARVRDAMLTAAADRSRSPYGRSTGLLPWLGAAAAILLVGIGIFIATRGRSLSSQAPVAGRDPVVPDSLHTTGGDAQPNTVAPVLAAAIPGPGSAGLTAQPRDAARVSTTLTPGASVQTKPGERRRVALADGSVLYVNQNTSLTLDAPRRVSVSTGEVFVEVSPRQGAAGGANNPTFVIKTPGREVSALGTRFNVRVGDAGTGVIVTQGKVNVSGLPDVVRGGEQLAPERAVASASNAITPAPRASHELDWTRDLVAAAESPLVPDSSYGGGALVVNDSNGQESRLSLRRYHVDVHIEDGFARTTIDQTYFNHQSSRLEGTFYFPLPPDAQLSRLAMYVNGKLMEGGMAERDHARTVYNDIVRKMQDPALLEWIDGSTFKMRVFPLEGRQEKRIVLSYAQRLPSLYGQSTYRFPAGHSMERVNEWSFHARVKGGATARWESPSHALVQKFEGDDLLLDTAAKAVKPDMDVVLHLSDPRLAQVPSPSPGTPGEGGGEGLRHGGSAVATESEDPHPNPLPEYRARGPEPARFSSATQDGSRYLMLRYRPPLAASPARQRRDWVFLFESSGSRDPLLARVQVDVIRSILENAEHDDTFTILMAATRTQPLTTEPLPATPANVRAAVALLEKTHLVGALDLGHALAAAAPFLERKRDGSPYLVHVGTGVSTMGERREDVLAKQIPDGAHYVGIAVGKRWSRSFMKQAAARTGGYYTQVNPDEPTAWRGFEILSTLNTPRLLDLKVEGDAGKAAFLCHDDAIAQGEELCAVTRVNANDPFPTSVTVTGSLDGQPFRQTIPVATETGQDAGYLPRVWAKLEIDRLLADNAEANKPRVIELSKAMYVMSPFTSLLVLENEQMYAQYNVDRGRKDHWAMYPCPEQIEVVTEALPAGPAAPVVATTQPAKQSGKPSVEQVLATIALRRPPALLMWGEVPVLDRGTDFAIGIRPLLEDRLAFAPQRRFRERFDIQWPPISPDEERRIPYDDILRHPSDWPDISAIRDQTVALERGWNAGERAVQAQLNRKLPEVQFDRIALSDTVDFLRDVSGASIYVNWRAIEDAGIRQDAPVSTRLYNVRFSNAVQTILDNTANGRLGYAIDNGVITISTREDLARFGSTQSLRRWDSYAEYDVDVSGASNVNAWDNYWMFSGADDYGMLGRSGLAGPTMTMAGLQGLTLTRDYTMNGGSLFRHPKMTSPGMGRYFKSNDGWARVQRIPALRTTSDGSFGDQVQQFRLNRAGLQQFGWHGASQGVVRRSPGDREFDGAIFRRPAFSNDRRVFRDLLAFAPGMNTTGTDVRAVLEAEADVTPAPAGTVDPGARALIDRARSAGWQQVTIRGPAGSERSAPAYAITFDGAGRFAYERSVGMNLRERVVCDGRSLWHLYPDLGVGAKRVASRFHRAELTALVPWALPPVDELTRGADVRLVNDHTVAIVPLEGSGGEDSSEAETSGGGAAAARPSTSPATRPGTRPAAPPLHIHLVFAIDGRLAERAVVEAGSGKAMYREHYDALGAVRAIDAEGKQVAETKLSLRQADEPALAPTVGDAKELVILPLPLRSRAHILATRKLDVANRDYTRFSDDDATALLAAELVEGTAELPRLVAHRVSAGDRRVGLHTLMLSAGQTGEGRTDIDVANGAVVRMPTAKDHPDSSLAKYAAQQVAWDSIEPSKVPDDLGPGDAFIARLAQLRRITASWTGDASAPKPPENVRAEQLNAATEFVRTCGDPYAAWAVVDVVRRRWGGNAEESRRLAGAVEALASADGLNYAARYEAATLLLEAQENARAADGFASLYRQALDQGIVPPIDGRMREALNRSPAPAQWADLLRSASERLITTRGRSAGITLAWQVHQAGDPALGNELLARATAGLDDANRVGSRDRVMTTLSAVRYLAKTEQHERADETMKALLADTSFADRAPAEIYRLASVLAERRGATARALTLQQHALDLELKESRALGVPVELEIVRSQFAQLLEGYQRVAGSVAALEQDPPARLLADVVRAADGWRAIDPDDTAACQAAGRALRSLGARDLAWDYFTTPLAEKPNEAGPWQSLAQSLKEQGETQLASKAYETAFDIEPTNAQLLWDRAQLLQQAGRFDDAQRAFRRLADGTWDARYASIVSQAKPYLR